MKRFLPALALATTLVVAPAHAAAGAGLQAGMVEFEPRVSFSHDSFKRDGYGVVDNFTSFDFSPTLGYCITDRIEVTGGVLIRHESVNGDGRSAVGATAGAIYNFPPQGRVIPFASLGFGALFYEGFSFGEAAVLAPMLAGGVRVLVGPSASVNMSLGYQHESNANGEFALNANRMRAGIGVSLFPWRAR